MVPVNGRVPPASFGRSTVDSSKRLAGGKDSPSGWGSRPVALHTAVISMPDLVPSRNELNIFGLIRLRSVMPRYWTRTSQTVSGVSW